ncbi:ankyrin repeat and LEM domain-containing protein 1-like protein [Aphelenchoides avenae]|nr:ankyrin repeat and LEM domain-containing protein 1-like protein [Aphelenchus avenae]
MQAAIEGSGKNDYTGKKYSSSLERMIRCEKLDTKTDMGENEERQLRLTRVGPEKDVSFFCYLLIDPTMLPDDLGSCTFEQFVDAGSQKLKRILSVWDDGRGVISLLSCTNIDSDEAFIREGGMIEAIGILYGLKKNVSNKRHEGFRACARNWTQRQKTDFGSLCLKKAFAVFQNVRCRPFFEAGLH